MSPRPYRDGEFWIVPERRGTTSSRSSAAWLAGKIPILGNHDYKSTNAPHPVLMELGWDEPPAQHYQTNHEGQHVFLSHYAQRT